MQGVPSPQRRRRPDRPRPPLPLLPAPPGTHADGARSPPGDGVLPYPTAYEYPILPLPTLWPAPRSAGLGQIDHGHLEKAPPELGELIVKIGGPAYRIGMGGGAASSVPSGSNAAELDFNAVQARAPAPGARSGLVRQCGGHAPSCQRKR
jgi:hypothetical protein